MKRVITTGTMSLAAALLLLPGAGAAQTPPAKPPAATAPQERATATAPKDEAREHLTQARAALDAIDVAALNARAKSQIAELKRRLSTLERAAGPADTTTKGKARADWGTEVAAMDKTLTGLLGAGSTTGASAPATTGTSGTAKGKAATVELNELARTKLLEVRTHLTAYATVMAGGKTDAPKESPAATAAAPASSTFEPAATSAAPAPATTAQATPPATASEPQTPQSAEPQAARPDEQGARRHLTEARNVLSELTQLPAASQLSGDARTHVSQLISNFNELITSQSDWRAAHAKVSANLTALLGPDGAAPAEPAPSGTPGAVGTSGAGMPTLDPAVREKLVAFRQNLSAFEKAAGGATASSATATTPAASTSPASSAAPSTPPASTEPTPSPAAPSTPATTMPPATTSSSAAAPSGEAAPSSANAEAMRHIAAIEALLKLEDESGGLTLTKAQVEQLRSHWAALRTAIK